jgi:hypothetical protein
MAGSKFRSLVEVLSVVDKGRRRDWTDAEKVRIVEESLLGYPYTAFMNWGQVMPIRYTK